MNLIVRLKSIKYFLIQNQFYLFIKYFILYFIRKTFLNRSSYFNPKCLGSFRAKIDIFSLDELRIYNNNLLDIDYIQSLRNLVCNNTTVFLVNVKSEILVKFLAYTLGIKVTLYNKKDNFKNIVNVQVTSDQDYFNSKIKKANKRIIIIDNFNNFDLAKIEDIFNCSDVLSKPNLDSLKPKKFKKFYFDVCGKVNLKSTHCIKKYNLYSLKQHVTKNTKKTISAISVLKNLDLYPFDICYESVLNFVDEFHLGIDIASFNKRYKKRLELFLKQTKYKNKIKIHFFDFKSETVNNTYIKGRWIADAFNIVANKCTSKYVLNLGADEFFDASLNKNFYNFLKNNKTNYEEFIFRFYHLLDNFNFIRDPEFAAYNYFTRIFEREKYTCGFDGVGFRKINSFRPKLTFVKSNIFHIGYLECFKKKKIKHHFSKDGIFYELGNEDNFKNNFNPIKLDNDLKKELINLFEKYLT